MAERPGAAAAARERSGAKREARAFVLLGVQLAFGAGLAWTALAAPAAAESELAALADCRWAVEEVYWRHRIWPESNPGPKPPLAEVLPRETVEQRMDDALRQVTALAEGWNVRLDGAALQRELDRMARNTKDAAMLRELFAAAGSGERAALCLALPELAKSRLASLYAEDPEIHRLLREQAEAALASVPVLEGLADHGAEVYETRYVRRGEGAQESPGPDLELDEAGWAAEVAALAADLAEPGVAGLDPLAGGLEEPRVARASDLPRHRRSRLAETDEAFLVREVREAGEEELVVATALWRKTPVDTWWEERRESLPRTTVAGGEVALPEVAESACLDDTWTPTAVDFLPAARYGHVAVWTGSEMVVWGGYDGANVLATGGRYAPATDTWAPISNTGRPAARWFPSAVWTGTQMIVWGGASTGSGGPLATGGRYTPGTDQWAETSTGANAPAARYHHAATWTGTQMLVWGGIGVNFSVLSTGAVYTPGSNLWATMGGTPPPARFRASAVWTGAQMVVWGGEAGGGVHLGDGGRYTPGSPGSWSAMATAGAPSARSLHTAVWTGSEMVVFGGTPDNATGLATGGRYAPASNSWLGATSPTGTPAPRYIHTAVWSGSEVIVWGGGVAGTPRDSGGRYDPGLDEWTPTNRSTTPARRAWFASVWTGSEWVVWGGFATRPGGAGSTNSGGRYTPATDSWASVSLGNAPLPVQFPQSVWTGTEMIVWGGAEVGSVMRNGGRYSPAADSWGPVTDTSAPGPRYLHTAIWSGSEMIVWGGQDIGGVVFSSGGRYDPSANSWAALPTGAAPARSEHEAVWAGTEMIVWGGWDGANSIKEGRRYFPPPADAWTPTAVSPGVGSRRHSAIWSGRDLIVWGGLLGGAPIGQGLRYQPPTDTWQTTSTANHPSDRFEHTASWAGTEMLVWGGRDSSGALGTGARYAPRSDSWLAMSTSGAPSPRYSHHAVWTGSGMIVWGGFAFDLNPLDTGSMYCARPEELFQDDLESGGLDSWSAVRP